MAFPSPTEFPANPFAKMFEGGPFDLNKPFEFKTFDPKAYDIKGLEASTLMRVPVGAASPLWGLFIGAAATGAAFWWMSQWAKPQNLDAVFGGAAALPELPEIAPSAVIEAEAEPVLAVAEAAEAMVETVAESTIEAVAEPVIEAAPVVAEVMVEAVAETVEAAPVVAEQVIEAVSEVVEMAPAVVEAEIELAEPVIEAAPVVAEAIVEAVTEPVVEAAPVRAEAVAETVAIEPVVEAAAEIAEPVIEAAPDMIEPVVESAEALPDLPVGGEAAPVSILAEAPAPKAPRARKPH